MKFDASWKRRMLLVEDTSSEDSTPSLVETSEQSSE